MPNIKVEIDKKLSSRGFRNTLISIISSNVIKYLFLLSMKVTFGTGMQNLKISYFYCADFDQNKKICSQGKLLRMTLRVVLKKKRKK